MPILRSKVNWAALGAWPHTVSALGHKAQYYIYFLGLQRSIKIFNRD